MSGLRRGVKGRVAWVAILLVLTVSITLVSAGVALADRWTDISDAQWQSQYGITATQAASVAGGYQDGSFHPKEAVKRGQFAKMVVDGFDVAYYTPNTPTFPDVPKSNTFFKYVEGGVKAGIISGYTDGTFKPNNTVSRQQANNILGSYLSDLELEENGVITGSKGTYGSLSQWYAAEGALILAAFKDATKVAAVHAPGTAYLVFHEVVLGSNGNLTPGSTLTRAQAVALIIRVGEVDFEPGTGSLPTVTGLNPQSGPATGGNGVVITGSNFTGVSNVKFGGTSAGFVVNSATQITATAPPGTAGETVDVTVVTTAGTSVTTNATKYSYGLPIVTKLEPSGGPATGNTSVKITGKGFTGVTAVRFGSIAAKTFTVLSPTEITAVSPAGTSGTTVDVTVTTTTGTSTATADSKFTYGVPVITKIDPAAGPATGGNTIIITGTGFIDITGAAGVTFKEAGKTAVNATSYTVNTSEKITVVVPAGTAGTSVDVIITNSFGQSGTTALTTKYSYGPPTITKLNPSGGDQAGGETVTITGTGFTGVSAVKFGTVNAKSFIVTTPSTMTAVAPAGTAGTTVEVYVTTPAGTNSATGTANDYSYGVPVISSLNPAAGTTAGGNNVVITGTNFVGIATTGAVKFGGKNANYTVNSSTQITAVAPPGTAGETVEVIVTNTAGASAANANSKYSYGIPAITSLAPAAGAVGGGNSVVINGTGFTGVTSVKFGNQTVSYTVNSEKKITATAPAGALDTSVEVTVTTPAGVNVSSDTTSSTTDNTKYRYIVAPAVDSVDPNSGPVEGGNVVTVTGSYFVDVTSVKFGTKAATDITIISDTELTCKAPSGTTGTTVSVIVTNPVGSSPNTAKDDYNYGMPKVTGLNPAAGPVVGGNTVIISGTGFSGVTSVRFYYKYDTNDLNNSAKYVDATSYTVNSLTQITAVVPAYSDGAHGTGNKRLNASDYTVDVVVTNGTGASDVSGASKYSYGAPVITAVEPSGGPAAGGNSVVVYGRGFTGTPNSMSVMFGTTNATITAINTNPASGNDCTEITVKVPAQGSMPATVYVQVTTPAGTSTGTDDDNDYHYGAPTVSSVSPGAGTRSGGNSVVIKGTGFTETSDVYFGTRAADQVYFDSATQLTAIAPDFGDLYDETVHVYVQNGTVKSSGTIDDLYSFGVPFIDYITPTGGPTGTEVEIHGYNFTGIISVKFGAETASYQIDKTTLVGNHDQVITAIAPSGNSDDTVDVVVRTSAGMSEVATSTDNDFSYGRPTITSLVPAAGTNTGGNTIVINGTNFNRNSLVFFDYVQVDEADVDYVSSTKLEVVVPNGDDYSTVDVQVETDTGSGGLTSQVTYASRYSYGAPKVTGLDPRGGVPGGGTTVTITGTGFTGVTAVKFGTKAATSFDVDEDSLLTGTHIIRAVAPAGTVGTTVNVYVTNGYTTSTNNDEFDDYTYGIPTVTKLSPGSGTEGDLVIITGTNFTGVEAVFFGGEESPVFAVNSATQITAQVPGLTDGVTVDVTVTNGAATSATSTKTKFSYGAPTITGLSPNNGSAAGGNNVVIYGTGFAGLNFAEYPDAVMFGANAATSYTVNEDTLDDPIQSITAKVPAGTLGTTVTVTVENEVDFSDPGDEGDIEEPWDYHYGIPTVTNLDEASGHAGDRVDIYGSNFVDGETQVFFDNTEVVTDINFVSSTHIWVNAPAHSNGTVDVTVVTGAGTSAVSLLKSKFTYGAPVVSAVNPEEGATNDTVIITGSGFTGIVSVKFIVGATALTATVLSHDSTTQIQVRAPNFDDEDIADVQVTTYGGEDTLNNCFTYNE